MEGVPPSPAQEATLAEQHLQSANQAVGSPTPVIIPPTFQVRMPLRRVSCSLLIAFRCQSCCSVDFLEPSWSVAPETFGGIANRLAACRGCRQRAAGIASSGPAVANQQ